MSFRFGAFAALVAVGCSASGGGGQDVGTQGGSGGAPVISGTGGSDVAPAVPGIGDVPSGFNVDDPGGVPDNRCNELDVQFEKIVPTVAVLVDRSKSMFFTDARRDAVRAELWDPLFDALTNATDGVIPTLQADIRFGFTAYNRDDAAPASCPNLQSVPIALDNAGAITAVYSAAGVTPENYYKWDTPTAASVQAVTQQLVEFAEPGPKYILLVTDGNPDRCIDYDPNCGQDDAIAAVQAAFAAGITTFVVGIGDVTNAAADPGCWGRCGPLHLQDLANAGSGVPVLRNTDQQYLNNCFNGRRGMNDVRLYVGTYVDDPALAGAAPFFVPNGRAALRDVLAQILTGVRSCTFALTETVRPGSESTGTVLLDGEPLSYGAADGWSLTDGTNVQVTGAACERVQNEAQSVDISFPCESYIR